MANAKAPTRILHVDGDSFFASCEMASSLAKVKMNLSFTHHHRLWDDNPIIARRYLR